MDADTKKVLSAGVGLAVLFVILQAMGAILTGTPSSSWNTGINEASTIVGAALILLIVGYVLKLVDFF